MYVLTKFGVPSNKGEYRATRHPYKLSFDINTKVENRADDVLPQDILFFTIPADIFGSEYDGSYLFGSYTIAHCIYHNNLLLIAFLLQFLHYSICFSQM